MHISIRPRWPLGLASLLALLHLTACGGLDKASTPDLAQTSQAMTASPREEEATAASRDACRLLDMAVLERIFDQRLITRSEEYPDWSSCEYFTATNDVFRMALSVHYEGGREGWEIEHAARGEAEDLLEAQEGIQVDSLVRPGYVAGLGDAAHFNSLLTSQILIGDTLIQFIMPLMPNPERHFRPLGETVINRLRESGRGVAGP